jgi:hypothetical protein
LLSTRRNHALPLLAWRNSSPPGGFLNAMIIRQSAIPRETYSLWIAVSRATAVGLLLAADRVCSPIRPMPQPVFCRERLELGRG